jgi:hypothetical protein
MFDENSGFVVDRGVTVRFVKPVADSEIRA